MVELFSKDLQGVNFPSSKGNQLKWQAGGEWFKADAAGYEGLSEYMVSHLLRYSDLPKERYVLYDTEQIRYHDRILLGSRSPNFLAAGSQLFTWERLFRNQTGESLYLKTFHIPEVKDRLAFLVSQMEQLLALGGIGEYLTLLMEVDAVFLNEDRHYHNIAAILSREGSFQNSPLFDHGACLLSDTAWNYPLGEDIYEMIGRLKSNTIAATHLDQLDAAEASYGVQLHFSFGEREIDELLEAEPYYPKEMKDRVKRILLERRRQMAYLFHQ